MPTVATLGAVLVRVYADDHLPPHFHVDTPDFHALVRIEDLAIHRGALDGRILRLVREWALENRELLDSEWRPLNER